MEVLQGNNMKTTYTRPKQDLAQEYNHTKIITHAQLLTEKW